MISTEFKKNGLHVSFLLKGVVNKTSFRLLLPEISVQSLEVPAVASPTKPGAHSSQKSPVV